MTGVPVLREAIADKIQGMYGRQYDANTEITITAGATQAIITAILAVVGPGDEVIVLEPCYDSYVPNIELAGGTVVRVPLQPGTFRPDFDKPSPQRSRRAPAPSSSTARTTPAPPSGARRTCRRCRSCWPPPTCC